MNGSEEREGVIRLLGFLVLASAALSAYCLGLLGFTFATGDLPYGLQPMAKAVQPANLEKPIELPKVKKKERREGEAFVQEMYDYVETERKKLAAEAEKVAERQRLVDQMVENEKKLKAELDAAAKNLDTILDKINKQEDANAKRLAGILTQAEITEAVKMVLEMDEKVAARILFYLPPKRSGELFSAMTKKGDVESARRATKIMERVHRMSEEVKP